MKPHYPRACARRGLAAAVVLWLCTADMTPQSCLPPAEGAGEQAYPNVHLATRGICRKTVHSAKYQLKYIKKKNREKKETPKSTAEKNRIGGFFWGWFCSERAPGQYGRAHRATELEGERYLAVCGLN